MKNITFKNTHRVLIGMLVLAILMISIVAFISVADTTRVALAEGDMPDGVWQNYLDGGYEEGMQFDQNEMVCTVIYTNPVEIEGEIYRFCIVHSYNITKGQ